MNHEYSLYLILGFGAFVITYVFIIHPLMVKIKYGSKDYHWYAKTYPQAMRGKKATCHACGSDRIAVRAIMNRTYYNRHVCTNCGETLYYSPEK